MPITYWILKQADITYAVWRSPITPREMRENFERYISDPDYRTGRQELIDLRLLSSLNADFGHLSMLLSRANAQDFGDGPGTNTVILAPDDLAFGRGRQYKSMADNEGGIAVHVVRREDEALALLGRSELSLADFLRTQADFSGPIT
ncbi:MAG: hypothetical protein AAF401_16325 [Pseudomonadota bacterium]